MDKAPYGYGKRIVLDEEIQYGRYPASPAEKEGAIESLCELDAKAVSALPCIAGYDSIRGVCGELK